MQQQLKCLVWNVLFSVPWGFTNPRLLFYVLPNDAELCWFMSVLWCFTTSFICSQVNPYMYKFINIKLQRKVDFTHSVFLLVWISNKKSPANCNLNYLPFFFSPWEQNSTFSEEEKCNENSTPFSYIQFFFPLS